MNKLIKKLNKISNVYNSLYITHIVYNINNHKKFI